MQKWSFVQKCLHAKLSACAKVTLCESVFVQFCFCVFCSLEQVSLCKSFNVVPLCKFDTYLVFGGEISFLGTKFLFFQFFFFNFSEWSINTTESYLFLWILQYNKKMCCTPYPKAKNSMTKNKGHRGVNYVFYKLILFFRVFTKF